MLSGGTKYGATCISGESATSTSPMYVRCTRGGNRLVPSCNAVEASIEEGRGAALVVAILKSNDLVRGSYDADVDSSGS